METKIIPASMADINTIQQMFEDAIAFQKNNNYNGWENYDVEFIKADIRKKQLFKITNDKEILCIFSAIYKDPLIWRDKDNDNAIYLHRIVINRAFQGQQLFKQVLDWSIDQAIAKNLLYIRLDTWANNQKLINYYLSFGFRFIESFQTADTPDLPIQHRNLKVALLEYSLPDLKENLHEKALNKVNLQEEFSKITRYWNQQIIENANGQLIKLAKGRGAVNWHKHDHQDELFLVIKGSLTIQLRDRNIDLFPNEIFVVPRGVEHCPVAQDEVEILLMGMDITSNKEGGQPDWAMEN